MKAFLYMAVMPLWSSYLVRVYSWKLFLAKEGILNLIFEKIGFSWLIETILSLQVVGGSSLSFSTSGCLYDSSNTVVP